MQFEEFSVALKRSVDNRKRLKTRENWHIAYGVPFDDRMFKTLRGVFHCPEIRDVSFKQEQETVKNRVILQVK